MALVTVFSAYCVRWLVMHWGFLFDPALQNDDARTALFPFHRYGSNPWFAHDPLAREMMAYVTPGLWALYRCLVPLTDLYVASKWVQCLALSVLAASGWVLAQSRRGGLAAGLLLIFLVLSDSYAVGRIAGGHARAFAFPCFALWVAGVLSKKRWARIAAPMLGSLFYPAVMLMILAGEAFYAVRHAHRLPICVVLRRIRRASMLAAACAILALPSVLNNDKGLGPIHTLQQAIQEPAFYRNGRLWVLPLGNPWGELTSAFVARFSASGKRLFGGMATANSAAPYAIAAIVLALIAWFHFRGWARVSTGVGAFMFGSIALYFASRIFAFRLYSTERYYAYCMRMLSCLLLVAIAARLVDRRGRGTKPWQDSWALSIILVQWIFFGDGIDHNNGMTLDAHWDADLYEFIRTLPCDVRFASHPMDGDGITYFGARATVGSFETLQPWFVDSWRRQKVREFATLEALYSPELKDIVAYGRRYSVTHLLVNKDRYEDDYASRGASFEPFTSYVSHLLNQPNRRQPALVHVPAQAVVFDRSPWLVVDLEKLRRSVSAAPMPTR